MPENTASEYPFVMCTEWLYYCPPGKAGSSLCPLTSDLASARGLIDRAWSFSQWMTAIEKKPILLGWWSLLPPCAPCLPESGSMQVWSTPTTPGPSQVIIFHVYLIVSSLAIKAAFTVMFGCGGFLLWPHIWLICCIHVSNSLHTKGMD